MAADKEMEIEKNASEIRAKKSRFDWAVERIPNWGRVWSDEIDFQNPLWKSRFLESTRSWKPIIIRGGCKEWPAFDSWKSDDYLAKRWGRAKLDTFLAPNPQSRNPESSAVRSAARVARTLTEFLASREENISVRAVTLGGRSPLASMTEDIGDQWLVESTSEPLNYARRRVFIHKGGVSLWHRHPVDEHLTFQVRGEKDFVLLPPDQSNIIYPIYKNEIYSFNVNLERYPKWPCIKPICARLGAGDAIYIPPGWWHTVVPTSQELGITVASTWGSSRLSILRNGLFTLFTKGNREYLPYMPLLAAYALTGWRRPLSLAKRVL